MTGQDPKFVKSAFAKIADRYVLTNHILSLGADILWRKKVGRLIKELNPSNVLDVATGTGDLALEIQKRCPEVDVLGADFCPEMLRHAAHRGVSKTQVADAMNLPFGENEFDLVTVAFGLRNMENWQKALSEMKRVIVKGGHLLVLDFSLPMGVLRKPYGFYLNQVLPKMAGLVTGERQAYEYLATSIERFPSGQKMLGLFEQEGFKDCQWFPLTCGVASIYLGTA